MNIEILISFILASTVLAIAPGPDNIFVLMQSIVHGKKYGIATVLGLVSGCLIHTTLVAFGISAILKESVFIFFIIKIIGALYLLYLAYKVFRSDPSISFSSEGIAKQSTLELYKQGFLMNVLNPKVSIFFLAFFPGFLFSDSLHVIYQFYILGFIFMLVTFSVFGSIALLASQISEAIQQQKNIGQILKWLQIIVFVAIAIFIVL